MAATTTVIIVVAAANTIATSTMVDRVLVEKPELLMLNISI
jgi:hypothetical protein